MKHIILSGGRPWYGKDGGKQWVEALLKHCGGEARITVCLFAQEESEWLATMKVNADTIKRFAGDCAVELRTMGKETFVEFSQWANVILIPGGDPEPLKAVLQTHADLLDVWDGKTISGHSAGADVLVRRYLYLQDRNVYQGLGWVPVDFIPHWQAGILEWKPEDWSEAEARMANAAGDVPLLTVREADFVELSVR